MKIENALLLVPALLSPYSACPAENVLPRTRYKEDERVEDKWILTILLLKNTVGFYSPSMRILLPEGPKALN